MLLEVKLVGPSHPVRNGSCQLTVASVDPGSAKIVVFSAQKISTTVYISEMNDLFKWDSLSPLKSRLACNYLAPSAKETEDLGVKN